MGNLNGDGLGEFFCIDAETLRTRGTWTKSQEKAAFGYDFWYQPYHDTLIATEWGAPRVFKKGYVPKDIHDPSKYILIQELILYKDAVVQSNHQMINDNLQRSMAEA